MLTGHYIFLMQCQKIHLLCTFHLVFVEDCCYKYQHSPGNLICNPQGQPSAVVLVCNIYSPNGSDVTVRWYRSTQEHLTRVQGEFITNGYNDNITRNLLPFSSLISSHHNRIIENFNESLNGFYWCQIEVNNTCLQPSPYGRIIFNSSSENNCSSDNTVMRTHVPPLCANKVFPVSKTTATPTASCSDGTGPCNLGIVIGAPVGAVVVCILLVVLLALCLIRRKRKKQKRVDHVSHSATSEYNTE